MKVVACVEDCGPVWRSMGGGYCWFSYILLSSSLVKLVSEHRECVVVEEKNFPACVRSFKSCLALAFIVFRFTSGHSPSYRRCYWLFNHSKFVKLVTFTHERTPTGEDPPQHCCRPFLIQSPPTSIGPGAGGGGGVRLPEWPGRQSIFHHDFHHCSPPYPFLLLSEFALPSCFRTSA